MDVKNFITALIPFKKSAAPLEYYFALNITPKKLQASLWTIKDDGLHILNPQFVDYAEAELISATDKLLDACLGESPLAPEKILFGVPDSWLLDDNLKDEYSKILKNLLSELDIKPMAYVSTSHAITHFLESKEGAPATAILIGIDEMEVSVTVSRAGRVDGSKLIQRGDNLGEDIEKALLSFTEVEVLPSRMLLFSPDNHDLTKQKATLLSYPWMDKLSFLHFPKIDLLENNILIKAVALAGATELRPHIKLSPFPSEEILVEEPKDDLNKEPVADNFGFVTGDITKMEVKGLPVGRQEEKKEELLPPPINEEKKKMILPKFLIKLENLGKYKMFAIPIVFLLGLILAYLFFARAEVTVFVEPRVTERDSQVTADPKVKVVDEANKIIPGEIVEISISGSEKTQATGKKQIGDAAKGTAILYNKTYDSKTFSKGATFVSKSGLRFTLDQTVTVASQSASEDGISFGKINVPLLATEAGADYNLTSGTEFTALNLSSSQFSAKAEGNFSGGTSKEVTVVSDSDQKRLLAEVAVSLRKQAAEKLQGKLTGQKILEEGLREEITSKSYNKNINDQTTEFSLNLTVKYKGTAYKEDDLKLIVSKLLESSIPADFELNLAQTETLADVSKLEKDGRLIFLARFKAKLLPKLDQEKIKQQIRGQSPQTAASILKTYDNVLGSDINIVPVLPLQLARLPFLTSNIKLEVKLK